MYKRLYGTREGRNVVLNPVPSQVDRRKAVVSYKSVAIGIPKSK